MKKIILIILILSAITFAGMMLERNVPSGNSKAAVVLSSTNGQKLRKAELVIEGMWCASCAVGAEYSLKAIDGVADVYIGFTDDLDGEGWVVYENGKVTEEQIIRAIEPYKATIVSDAVYTEDK